MAALGLVAAHLEAAERLRRVNPERYFAVESRSAQMHALARGGLFVVQGCGLAAWLFASAPTAAQHAHSFPQSTLLARQDIEEAVARGRNGGVSPYLVSRPLGGPPARTAVYTPFIRVALAARAGALTFDGTHLQSAIAPAWIAGPEILVVIGSPCSNGCSVAGELRVPPGTAPTRLYVGPHIHTSPAPLTDDAKPIRVVPLGSLRWLGAIPVDEPSVAATFSPAALRAGAYVVAEWGDPNDVVFVAGAHLQPVDIARWR